MGGAEVATFRDELDLWEPIPAYAYYFTSRVVQLTVLPNNTVETILVIKCQTTAKHG